MHHWLFQTLPTGLILTSKYSEITGPQNLEHQFCRHDKIHVATAHPAMCLACIFVLFFAPLLLINIKIDWPHFWHVCVKLNWTCFYLTFVAFLRHVLPNCSCDTPNTLEMQLRTKTKQYKLCQCCGRVHNFCFPSGHSSVSTLPFLTSVILICQLQIM